MSFKEGFLDGWKSVNGKGAAIPPIPPSPPTPPGRTQFELGYARGVARAKGG